MKQAGIQETKSNSQLYRLGSPGGQGKSKTFGHINFPGSPLVCQQDNFLFMRQVYLTWMDLGEVFVGICSNRCQSLRLHELGRVGEAGAAPLSLEL